MRRPVAIVKLLTVAGETGRRRSPQVYHGARIWYHPDWREVIGFLGLEHQQNWRMPVDVPPVSATRRVIACYRIALPDGRTIYYKRTDYRVRLKKALLLWLRPGKAGIENWGYQRYRACGIDVPQTVAYGESRVLGLLRASFIMTKEVPDSVSLDDFVSSGLPGIDAQHRVEKMNAFAGRLIAIIRKAHEACLFHYDLKWRNILVHSRNGEYYPVIIDCPRAFESRLRRTYGITTDLSALARLAVSYLTLMQRYRFLAACLGDSVGPKERKAWYRRVQRRLAKRPPRIIAMRESPLRGVRFEAES